MSDAKDWAEMDKTMQLELTADEIAEERRIQAEIDRGYEEYIEEMRTRALEEGDPGFEVMPLSYVILDTENVQAFGPFESQEAAMDYAAENDFEVWMDEREGSSIGVGWTVVELIPPTS